MREMRRGVKRRKRSTRGGDRIRWESTWLITWSGWFGGISTFFRSGQAMCSSGQWRSITVRKLPLSWSSPKTINVIVREMYFWPCFWWTPRMLSLDRLWKYLKHNEISCICAWGILKCCRNVTGYWDWTSVLDISTEKSSTREWRRASTLTMLTRERLVYFIMSIRCWPITFVKRMTKS